MTVFIEYLVTHANKHVAKNDFELCTTFDIQGYHYTWHKRNTQSISGTRNMKN
jgi:hypothetical protein